MLAENIRILNEKIAERCSKTGRNSSEITLIAVSKTMPVSLISEAYAAGLSNFGENKAQEFRDKSAEITLPLTWHFVGHLQNNKVKYVAGKSEFIHSVDSLNLASFMADYCSNLGIRQKILIEVNTSSEETKFGLHSFEQVLQVADFCRNNPSLELSGLMTMAPFTDKEVIIRNCFSGLRSLKEKLVYEGIDLTHLSMGMTNDFEFAIDEGSTMLRIGTAIFGERNPALGWRDK